MDASYDLQLQRLAEFARDPTLAPDELRRSYEQAVPFIERNGETKVRRTTRDLAWGVMSAVAGNPNTPLPTLARVVGYAPRAFCSNPVAPLIALEDPNWTKLLSDWSMCRLLCLSQAPPALVGAIAQGLITDLRRNESATLLPAREFLEYDPKLCAKQGCPAAAPFLVGAVLPPIVREARNHITVAPEIASMTEWRETFAVCSHVAKVSSSRRGQEEEWYPPIWREKMRRGWWFRRLRRPGTDADWDSWWIRMGIAEGARPLFGNVWAAPIREMLQELADDGHRLVRFAARARLAEPERDLWRD